MPVILEKMLRGVAYILELILHYPPVQHITAVVYLFLYMLLYYWAMLYYILIPLLTYWKPQIGIMFLLYAYWMYYDRHTPKMGGRKSDRLCKMFFYDSLRYYFRNRLIKTADLPEGKNYILAHYPHGLVPFNVHPNFLTNFNKVADLFPGIEMKSPLVPVFTFGETNIWNKVIVIPLGKRIEKFLKDTFHSPVALYFARGACILWPKKIPVSTIVGAPISVPKVEIPSKELIDKYYEKFYQALQDIFDKYKRECDIAGEKAKLIMMEE